MHYTISNPLRGAMAVQTITRITSFVSILGCSAVARQCWELKRQKKLTHMDKLVLVLCLVDLGLAIAWFIGNWPSGDDFACNFQVRWSGGGMVFLIDRSIGEREAINWLAGWQAGVGRSGENCPTMPSARRSAWCCRK